jgi:hypothetical protein
MTEDKKPSGTGAKVKTNMTASQEGREKRNQCL